MKKKNITIPLFVVILVLIIISVGIYFAIHFLSDNFKSNKEVFGKYMYENLKAAEMISSNELTSYINKVQTKPYSNEGSIKVNVTSSSPEMEKEISALQKCSITFVGKVDNSKKSFYQNISANYSDSQALKFEVYKKDDIFAGKIDEIMNKYMGFQNKNLKAFAKKLGVRDDEIEKIPDSIDFSQLEKGKNIFTDEEKKQLMTKYYTLISENLSEDMFTKEKIDSGTVYTLSIPESKLISLSKTILQTFKDDELIIGKIRDILTSNNLMTIDEANNIIQKMKSFIDEMISSNNTNANGNILDYAETILPQTTSKTDSKTEQNLILKVYTQNNQLVKTEIIIGNFKFSMIKSSDGVTFEIMPNSETPDKTYSVILKKVSTADEIKYEISVNKNSTQIASLSISFTGISTNSVKEMSEFLISSDAISEANILTNSSSGNLKYNITYTNNKTFADDVVIDIIPENQILLFNTVPNVQTLQNALTQVGQKFEVLNNSKLQASFGGQSITSNPFLLYYPAILPISATMLMSNPNNEVNLALPGIVMAGSSMVMLSSDNGVIARANEAKTNSTKIEEKDLITITTTEIRADKNNQKFVQGQTDLDLKITVDDLKNSEIGTKND